METPSRTAVVGSCTSRHEAELQRHVLEEAGIPTSIGSDDAGGLHPELGFSSCATYRLIVPEGRLDEAGAVLFDFDVAYAPSVDIEPADLGEQAEDAHTALGPGALYWLAIAVAITLALAAVASAVNSITGI